MTNKPYNIEHYSSRSTDLETVCELYNQAVLLRDLRPKLVPRLIPDLVVTDSRRLAVSRNDSGEITGVMQYWVVDRQTPDQFFSSLFSTHLLMDEQQNGILPFSSRDILTFFTGINFDNACYLSLLESFKPGSGTALLNSLRSQNFDAILLYDAQRSGWYERRDFKFSGLKTNHSLGVEPLKIRYWKRG